MGFDTPQLAAGSIHFREIIRTLPFFEVLRFSRTLPVRVRPVAPQLTVVTMHTTAQSSVVAPVKDAHAASGVPNERAAHETTAVPVSSSNDR